MLSVAALEAETPYNLTPNKFGTKSISHLAGVSIVNKEGAAVPRRIRVPTRGRDCFPRGSFALRFVFAIVPGISRRLRVILGIAAGGSSRLLPFGDSLGRP